MKPENVLYSVVVPVFRSEKTLNELIDRLTSVFKSITPLYEIILVEDCGGDGSWDVMKTLRSRDPRIRIIQLMTNFGQHNALICGFHFVKGDYIITMDDDLQNPPEEIPKLIQTISDGFDVVYGEYIQKQHSFFRNFGSSLIQFVYKKVFGVKENLTAFRIIRREVLQTILQYDKNYVFLDGLLAWSTKNIGYVPVTHRKRAEGRSGYSLRKLFTLSLNMVTNFSIVPLQIATLMGLVFATIGFALALLFLLKKLLYGVPVEGFTSIIIAVTIFSGIQLLTLGLIGEYLGRIHLNINHKPQFLIREKQVE